MQLRLLRCILYYDLTMSWYQPTSHKICIGPTETMAELLRRLANSGHVIHREDADHVVHFTCTLVIQQGTNIYSVLHLENTITSRAGRCGSFSLRVPFPGKPDQTLTGLHVDVHALRKVQDTSRSPTDPSEPVLSSVPLACRAVSSTLFSAYPADCLYWPR